MSLKIDPRDLPAEGLHLEGRLPASIFGLAPDDIIQAKSPLDYSLDVMRDEEDIFVTGSLAVTFELECGRCTERFENRMELPAYAQSIEIENDAPIDLTILLREDIILALPTYPRCEQGNLTLRECPAEGRFEPSQEPLLDESPEAEPKVWEALDQLKDNLKRN